MRLIFIAWFMLLIPAISQAREPEVANAEQALSLAESKYQQSKSMGFAWNSTRQAIAKGQAALAAGDLELAMKQAQNAIATAEASIAQAHREAVDWQQRAPLNE